MLVTPSHQALPNAVLGMIIFVIVEVMLFAALVSAYLIVSSSVATWPPVGQPRLSVVTTAINSFGLLLSGFLLFKAHTIYHAPQKNIRFKPFFLSALILGILFVVVQGMEWVRLIGFGLTMTSSVFGSFFYLIIGAHGLHATAAIVFLGVLFCRFKKGSLKFSSFWAAEIFWYFVVLIWPVLYVLVYLS